MKKTISVLLSVLLVFSLSFTAFAANKVPATAEWAAMQSSIFSDTGKISLMQGEEAGDVNFSWVVPVNFTTEKFVYSDNKEMTDGINVDVTSINNASVSYVVNRVSLYDLKPGTYYYMYTFGGAWQPVASFKVQDASDGFSVMFCSDPQLGRSGGDSDAAILDDSFGWQRTLAAATAKNPDISFIMSAGDQVNEATNKKEYNALLYPEVMKSYSLVTTVGNHDFYSPYYAYHFNNPNVSSTEMLSPGGNDYYFSYGNALFISINTQNYLMEDHKAVLNEAVTAYPDAMWRVVLVHHTMYYPGQGGISSSEAEGIINGLAETAFVPMFDDFDIDMVLSGHCHIYSRSIPLTNGKADANGVTYLEASSASGSNYYSTDAADSNIAFAKTTSEPTYSLLDFSGGSVTVNSYGTDSDELFDTVTLTKSEPSSADTGYSPAEWYLKVVAKIQEILAKIFSKLPFDISFIN